MFDCIAYGIDSPGWPVNATLESFFNTESDAITWAKLYFADGNGGWEYIAIQKENCDPIAYVLPDGTVNV